MRAIAMRQADAATALGKQGNAAATWLELIQIYRKLDTNSMTQSEKSALSQFRVEALEGILASFSIAKPISAEQQIAIRSLLQEIDKDAGAVDRNPKLSELKMQLSELLTTP